MATTSLLMIILLAGLLLYVIKILGNKIEQQKEQLKSQQKNKTQDDMKSHFKEETQKKYNNSTSKNPNGEILVDVKKPKTKEPTNQKTNYEIYTEEERKEWGRKLQENKIKKQNKDILAEANKSFCDTKQKSKTKMTYKEKVEKGKIYETFVSNFFKEKGYQVDPRGERKGVKDKGIDILAKTNDTYLLIQCKNYAETTKINHSKIKEFNSNCHDFINSNSDKLNLENTTFLYVVPNKKSFKNCAIKYFQDKSNKCRYEIIELAA